MTKLMPKLGLEMPLVHRQTGQSSRGLGKFQEEWHPCKHQAAEHIEKFQ